MIQHTLSLIKPEAFKHNIVSKVLSYIEEAKMTIVAMKMLRMTTNQAKEFYGEHADKSFFAGLISNITSGPIIAQVLCGKDVIDTNRRIMGATDPSKAEKGTIRGDIGISIDHNLVHGSDSEASASREIAMFFSRSELIGGN